MSEAQGFIVDPDDPTKAIVTPSGRMAGTVWVAPVGSDPADPTPWRHVGFVGEPIDLSRPRPVQNLYIRPARLESEHD